ncbi:MAG: alpha/beta fold hydrolase [Butyricicoccus pullicaecorum]
MQNSIQFDAHYIDCGNACIAYYTFGQGEPLVLLHGNGEGSEYFAKCIPYLSRFYRVIAVDSRGHGKSERGEGKLNFDRMAEDLRMVFDGLGLEKAHMLGFSDGGNLAIKFTLLYPQRVDS